MQQIPELGMSEDEFKKIAHQIAELLQVKDTSTGYVVMRFDTFANNMIVQNVCSGAPENIIEALRVTAQTIEEARNGVEKPPMH